MKRILLLLILFVSIRASATIYYVSSSGSDSNNGTSTITPILSLTKVNSLNLVAGDQVLFKKGDTFYGTLNVTKSGTLNNVITFGAYGSGENPIITGFTSVTSWTNLGSNIYESTNAVSTLSTLNMVSIGGVNTAMGKYPNSGYFTYQSNATTSITSSDLDGVINWTGAELMVRCNYYFQQRTAITSQSGSTLNFSNSSKLANGYGFFIQNDARTLDQQNEWYYNPATKKIRIYSTSQPSNVRVSSVEYPIYFSNVNSPTAYIKIENINVEGANSIGIYRWSFGSSASRANHIEIDNCSVLYSGVNGISVRANYLTITDCIISDVNGNGINVGYNPWNVIERNTINNIGLHIGMLQTGSEYYYGATSGINTQHTQNSSISYNKITNCGYDGINFGGSTTRNTIIKNNVIDNFCLVAGDGGGIYGSYHSSAVIDGNIVMTGVAPITGTNQSFAQAVGIYLDDNTDTCEVKNNTVYNASCYGLQYNSTSNINTHHNTVYASGRNELRLQRWSGELALVNNDFSYNKFITKSASQKVISLISYENDIPTFGVFDHNYYARPLDNNTIISVNQPSTGSASYTLAQWKTFSGMDANSVGTPKTLSSASDIFFYYNSTGISSTINIDQPSIDVASTAYYTPTTLQPYTSLVTLRDATLGTYYYVSTSGSDSNSGLLMSDPWKTLAKLNATNFADGSRIYMKSGDVWSGETLNFTNATQGWDDEILVTSYGTGSKPVISGFETLTSWTSDGNGIYHTTISNSACNMVTVNGVNTPIARYPKTGYLTFETYSGSTSITDNELPASPSWSGGQAVVRINGFQYNIATISGHTSHTLTLSGGSTPDATGEYKYFLQNHPNALTAIGDWYKSGTTLYMYFGANSPSSYVIKAAKTAKLVTTDKSYVTLDGIRIEGAVEKGYESVGTHNTVQNCDFEFMGRYGATFAQTTPTVDNNTFSNSNGTAVFMNANSYVLSNNTISNIGLQPGMVENGTNNQMGISIIAGSGGTCEYNKLSNIGYIGISTWGSSNIIRYNKVDGFCSHLPDGGGIYANYIGSAPYPTGIKVYNNIVLNGGGEGLYSDAVNQNTEWYNNTVSNCISGILLNTPINHSVHDNTFYNCKYGMNFYNWHTNSLTPTGCTVSSNTIVEGTNSTYAVKIGDSTNRDILSMGTITGNKFYSEIGKQAAQFKAYFTPSAPLSNYNIGDWRTLTGFETTSTLSTLVSFNKLSVIYNDTKVNKDFQVVSKKDLSGNYINGTITLTPFVSKVLVDGVTKYLIMNKKMYAY